MHLPEIARTYTKRWRQLHVCVSRRSEKWDGFCVFVCFIKLLFVHATFQIPIQNLFVVVQVQRN